MSKHQNTLVSLATPYDKNSSIAQRDTLIFSGLPSQNLQEFKIEEVEKNQVQIQYGQLPVEMRIFCISRCDIHVQIAYIYIKLTPRGGVYVVPLRHLSLPVSKTFAICKFYPHLTRVQSFNNSFNSNRVLACFHAWAVIKTKGEQSDIQYKVGEVFASHLSKQVLMIEHHCHFSCSVSMPSLSKLF